jgi:ATP/ADP translocase/HEAT repeat protein
MLRSFAEIRPEERRGTAAAFLSLFGILAGHTLLETARDALFLARLPASQLPWVYFAIAAIAVAVSLGPWRLPRPLSGRHSLALLLLICASVTLGFWLLGSWQSGWLLRALYVWSGLVGTLTALQFWLVLGELYTVTQAKRIYKVVATGSLLGAVAGAGLARVIARSFGAEDLVLGSALAFGLTAIGPSLLVRRPEASPLALRAPGSTAQIVRMMRREPYVRGLAGLILVSTVALTLADYVFKSTVAQNVAADRLAGFFATFYMLLNILALGAQLLLLGWLLRLLGLHRSLWVLPALLFVGAAGVAFGGGVVAALFLKGADGTLRHSLHRTGTELLFVPIPDSQRSRAKPFIDVVGQRGGQALASLFILAEVGLHRGDYVLASASAALSALWIVLAADLKGHYLNLFRSALRQGALQDRSELPNLDLGSLEALFAALNSQDDAEVVGAMDLLAAEGRSRLIPALVLYHPSRPVVLRALELLEKSGRSDFVPIADRLLGHPDAEIRAAALRARSTAKPDEAVLRSASGDPSPIVKATALAGLVSGGWISDEAQSALDELLGKGSVEARVSLTRAIERKPAPAFEQVLLHLAEASEPVVLAHVAHAMGAVKSERFLPPLLSMLAFRDVRAEARAALLAHGEAALRFLDDALADLALPHEIRRHLPRTLSRFPPSEAAAILLKHLLAEPDGMVRFKIIRGLGRIAADHPGVELDGRALREATQRTLEAAFGLVNWRLTLTLGAVSEPRRATPGHELLVSLLRDKEVHAVERLFRLLGLQHRREDFRRIYRGLRNTSPKVRSGSRELLEALLEPPLRGAVLALVDDVPDAERLVQARPYLRIEPVSYEGLLGTLLEQPSETVRSIAAYHIGELGLQSLRGRLEGFDPRETGFFVSRVIERALRLLSRPSDGLAHA